MSNKVIKMPKRKKEPKIPNSLLAEAILNKEETLKGDSPEEVTRRGYSLLQIAIRIVGDRAIDMSSDVSILLDGKPLKGIGKIEMSAYPPHFGITIIDEKQFQDSINESGFFFAHGFTISQLLLGRNYPALKCATCDEEGRIGWLKLELSGMCDNPNCVHASPIVKAKKIQEVLQPTQQEDQNNPDNLPPVV